MPFWNHEKVSTTALLLHFTIIICEAFKFLKGVMQF